MSQKQSKISCVYALIFADGKHVYVGQSKDFNNREHICKNHNNYRIKQAYKLYGQPQKIILEIVNDLKERLLKESEYIIKMNADLNLRVNYNGCLHYAINGQPASWEEYISYELLNAWNCPHLNGYIFICDLPIKKKGVSTSLQPIEY